MRLRTQLILAFLLLAIVPLTGVVGYSYWTNVAALRSLLETEARQLTERLEENMEVASEDLRRGLSGLDQKLSEPEMGMEVQAVEEAIEAAMVDMGSVASAIQGWRFDQTAEAEWTVETNLDDLVAEIPPPPPVVPGEIGPSFDKPGEPLLDKEELRRRFVEKMARFDGMVFKVERDAEGDESRRVRSGSPSGDPRSPFRVRTDSDRWSTWPMFVPNARVIEGASREAAQQHLDGLSSKLAERSREMERLAKTGNLGALARLGLETAELARKRRHVQRILGDAMGHAERGPSSLVPELDVSQFINGVLRGIEHNGDEIPFAVDAENNVYTVATESFDQLMVLFDEPQDLASTSEEPVLIRREGWLIAHQLDVSSELTFGIARPYDASFTDIRNRTGRNLLLGFGMIGFSLVGILPLSSRLTQRISSLSAEAEKLAGGDLGARAPVRGRDELGHLALTFNRMASRLESNQQQLVEQELENQRKEVERTLLESENRRRGSELEEARKFQLAMLPDQVPDLEEFELAVYHRTATEVGGDYYDFSLDDDYLTIALGDATGHGARAATLVTVIRTLFLTAGARTGLATFLNEAAGPLRSMSLERMAMSLLLLRLDRRRHRLTFASAGMPPAYRLRPSGEVEEVVCHAVPLGAMSRVEYSEFEHDFEPGDTIVLLSDGLPEQADAGGEPIGYERLVELVVESSAGGPAHLVDCLRQSLEAATGGAPPSDDVTLVAVRRRST